MKNIFTLITLLFLFPVLNLFSQPQWVTFTDDHPSQPIIHLIGSTNQHVEYSVVIPGIYSEIINNGETYQRLSIPGGSTWGQTGYPQIPDVAKLVAIPECSAFTINIVPTDSVVLNDMNLYPTPIIVQDSSGGHEQFYKNDSVYSLDLFLPGIKYESKGGRLRNQRTLNVFGYPFKYNPQQKILVVYTNFNVTIEFQNPTTDVNVENGLFNKITKNTLINFNNNNTPSIPSYPPPTASSVNWISISDTADPRQIVADYLIITHDQFFNPHSTALQKFAGHRAGFNGFDVVIVNVSDILNPSLNWNIEPGLSNLDAEKKIREFIRRVWVNNHALHTYDGKLAFVCLIGDSGFDDQEILLPTSFDPNPTNFGGLLYSYNDYYYSCVTKGNNPTIWDWDIIGDLYIGRISAGSESDLNNYTAKLILNENEFTAQTWRSNSVLCYGGTWDQTGGATLEHDYWTTSLQDYLNTICPTSHHSEIIDALLLNTSWNFNYSEYLNNEGANIIVHHGHGLLNEWSFGSSGNNGYGLSITYKLANLHNHGKYPIALSHACYTGHFLGVGANCMGEALTNSVDGYIGYLGCPIADANINYNGLPVAQNQSFFIYFLNALYRDQSTVLGEAVLEARNYGYGLGTNQDLTNYKYILFGDPAYNCMTPGYEITGNLILPPPPPAEQTIMISNKVYIRSGGKLTLNHDAVIEFGEYGQLIIDEGGILEIGSNVKFKGTNNNNKIVVNGVFTGTLGTLTNPVPIVGLTLEPLPGQNWRGIEFNNPLLSVKFNGGSISHCAINGKLNKLESSNGQYYYSSGINLANSSLSISNAYAVYTNITVSNPQSGSAAVELLNSTLSNYPADDIVLLDHVNNYKIQGCTITYDHGTGINVNYSGWNGTTCMIDHNTIQNSGTQQGDSWGIKVYNSTAEITMNFVTNNRYGISCLNGSHTKIMGDPGATSLSSTQQIVNNYQNQIRAYDNSFPWYIHYNS